MFAAKPWYEPRPEFKAKTISALERANVREWFAAADKRKPQTSIMMIDDAKVSAAELLTWLGDAFATVDGPRRIGKAPAGAKLRTILVEITDPGVDATAASGTMLRFIYDDKDKLRAVSGWHYTDD